MQGIGHFKIDGKIVKVLVRQAKHYWSYRIRQSGQDGVFFDADSDFVNIPENEGIKGKLLSGQTIYV